MAWNNPNTHEDEEVEALLRGAAGRLVAALPAADLHSPWLNPIEMLWRHFRREVTHCELFANVKALIDRSSLRLLRALQPMLSVAGPLDHRFGPRRNYVNVLRRHSHAEVG